MKSIAIISIIGSDVGNTHFNIFLIKNGKIQSSTKQGEFEMLELCSLFAGNEFAVSEALNNKVIF